MLGIDSQYIPQVVTLAAVALTFLLNRWFQLRARLIYSVGHSSNILVEEPLFNAEGIRVSDRQLVRTASITLQNDGLISAQNVELTFNWKPPIFNVIPARAFTTETTAFDRFSLLFGSMAPHEQVTIDIMSINHDLPMMTSVRAENSVGRMIEMAPQRVWPRTVTVPLGLLALIGGVATIYWLALTGQAVVEFTSAARPPTAAYSVRETKKAGHVFPEGNSTAPASPSLPPVGL